MKIDLERMREYLNQFFGESMQKAVLKVEIENNGEEAEIKRISVIEAEFK